MTEKAKLRTFYTYTQVAVALPWAQLGSLQHFPDPLTGGRELATPALKTPPFSALQAMSFGFSSLAPKHPPLVAEQ